MSKRSDVLRAESPAGSSPTRPALEACDVFHIDPARVAHLRGALVAEASIEALAETFRVLGDPTRVRLLDALSHGELCVCDLATLLGLSESATSHQLRLLRTLRLVRARRAGRMVFYALDDRHIMTLFTQGLRHVEEQGARPARAR
ncbi:MAG: ArsR/SmtB family transcription factor [Vicinamibacterales bacterium]